MCFECEKCSHDFEDNAKETLRICGAEFCGYPEYAGISDCPFS